MGMTILTVNDELVERRKTWSTVSFGGIQTYDAFDRGGGIPPKDINRLRQHKKRLGDLSWDYLHENVWDDISVEPSSSEFLDMDCYEIQRLIDLVLIPHINVFSYGSAGIHQIQKAMPSSSAFVPADEFLHSVRTLSSFKGGAKVADKLIKDRRKDYFTDLLKDKVAFVDGDFRTYIKDTNNNGPQTQTLFLPGWVRNRLAHPENTHERVFPDAGDYGRATLFD